MKDCPASDNSSNRFAAYQIVPSELRSLKQWVCWRLEKRDGRETKVPYHPSGHRADTGDPSTWSSFAEVVAVCANGGGFNGTGFVFAAGGDYTGVDFDHHRDRATGEVDQFAREHIGLLSSYTEVSQSGE